MANARLLRQYLSDYNKKLGKEQGAYEDRYAGYKGQYDQYSKQATAYNQAIEQFNAAMGGLAPGSVYENENGQLMLVDPKKGSVGLYNDPNKPNAPQQAYKKDGNWYVDYPTSLDETWGGSTTPVQLSLVATHPGAAPTAPATPAPPEDVREPNLTQNDIKEITNPGLNQGQLAMQAARGYLGKSELAAENDPGSQNSAFTNLKGDDPNGLKEKGLVARSIAGEI